MSSGQNEDIKLPKVAIKCELKGQVYGVSISREVRKTGSISTYVIIGPIRDIERGHVTEVRATGLKIVAEPHFETSSMLNTILLKGQQ